MSRHRLPAARPDARTPLLAPVVDPDGARHRAPELPAPRPPADTAPATPVSAPAREDVAFGRHAAANRPADRPRHGAHRRPGSRRRGALVLVTVVACLLALPTVSSASSDRCRWQRAAQALFVALEGRQDSRSTALREALTQAGVGRDLPAECRRGSTTTTASGTATPSPTRSPEPTTASEPTSEPSSAPTSAPTSAPSSVPTSTAGVPATTGAGSTAAAAFGWGTPLKSDNFTDGLSQWGVYNGKGHDGNGRRTPSAVKAADGILTITGDGSGNSGGMAWGDGRKYGRYEARVRSTAGDDSYHPVMLLWPDAENWPVGGEIDWMEISAADRQDADTFLHFGADNDQVHGNVRVDATQWHNWAVEWTPRGVTTYLDGKPWWSTTNTRILPPGPMHMTIQLDYFGGGNPKTSQMQVDWVNQYAA